jgi:hypothetical protein
MLPHLNICCLFEARLQPKSAIALPETLRNPFTSYMLGYLISNSSFYWNLSMDGNRDVIHFFVRGILSSGNRISEATIALNVIMDGRRNTLAGLSRAAITIDTLVVSKLHKFHGDDQLSDIGLFFSNLANGDPLIIKHLHLKSLSLHDTYMNGFKSYLENTSVLRRLTLEECSIKSADGKALLSQGLQACKCLEMLVISFCPRGASILKLTGNKSIKKLEVYICSYQQLHAVFPAMCGNNIIEELIVKKKRRSPIDSRGSPISQELASKMLIMSTELESLGIHMAPASISVICNALSENSTLPKLTIATCTMCPCEGVANMLRLNKSLKELTILDCWLISDCEVTKELCRNRSLEKLFWRKGPSEIANIEASALIIKQNTTLRELEVPAQDHQQLCILSNALKQNKTLAELIITLPPHTKLADAIVTECAKDKRLTMQSLLHNPIPDLANKIQR